MATNNAINASDPIAISSGGTGAATLTQYGPLYVTSGGVLAAVSAGTNGLAFLGGTIAGGSTSRFTSLGTTAGSLSYTVGVNSLNIDVANYANKTSWTPVLTFGAGGTTGITYTTQTGTYCAFGSMIIFQMEIVLSSKGSSTGAATITGLPASSSGEWQFPMDFTLYTFGTGMPVVDIASGGSTLLLSHVASAGGLVSLTDTAFANTTALRMSGAYLI